MARLARLARLARVSEVSEAGDVGEVGKAVKCVWILVNVINVGGRMLGCLCVWNEARRLGCLCVWNIKGGWVKMMSGKVEGERAKVRSDVEKIYKTYQDLVETVKENLMEAGRVVSNAKIKDGEILDGLNILYHYVREKGFERAEDTYQCCAALHRWTKYLACDDKYKTTAGSKDDRFRRIYKNNYNFRRKWVAFLSGIVAYVELMYEDPLYLASNTSNEGERRVEAIRDALTRPTRGSAWWDGFDWATVRGHIDAAKTKIGQEPATKPLSSYVPWDRYTDGEMREREMAEMLGELARVGES